MRFFLLAVFCLFSLAFGVRTDANNDVKALVGFGARVSGSQNLENAAQYLLSEYRKIGADASIQTSVPQIPRQWLEHHRGWQAN
jgi:hypothetical protein